MERGRWWYDHTYQAFKARIKGLKYLKDNGLETKENLDIMAWKTIEEFVNQTDIDLTEEILIKLTKEILNENG